MKLLFIQPEEALGDLSAALPVLAAIRQHDPAIEIKAAVHHKFRKLISVLKLADGFINVWEAKAVEYDLVVDCRMIRYDSPVSLMTQRLRILPASWGSLSTPPKVLAPPDISTAGSVALHPCANRGWPLPDWVALATRLQAEGKRLLIIDGPSDLGYGRWLAKQLPGSALADRLPLEVLAAKLGSCSYFIGCDTGTSHLAAALQVPSTVLWGSGSPCYYPWNAKILPLSSKPGEVV